MTMLRLLLVFLTCGLLTGCGSPMDTEPAASFSFVVDAQTKAILEQLRADGHTPESVGFRRNFIGIYVPEVFLPYEPFVLGLATESPIPTVLFLDAPWVRRYAASNWLTGLASTGIYAVEGLVPAVAHAFSFQQRQAVGGVADELMGVPLSIKGNLLFYRQDILQAHRKSPPRSWEELKAICRDILPREKSLKYGLIFHVTNFVNDFYPVFWGFGGRTHDDRGNLIFLQPEMLAKAEMALSEIVGLQGALVAPGPAALSRFAAPMSLRQAFLRGEALFMVNWNTRLHDLRVMLADPQWQAQAAMRSTDQIGVAPIPSQSGRPQYFANVGSFGWAVNRFAVTRPDIKTLASRFLQLVTSDQVQILRAENAGEVPAATAALAQVRNPDVQRVYEQVFGSPTVVLQPRPYSRRFNDILEKHLQNALFGRQTPAQAIQAVAAELQRHGSVE